SRWSRSSSRPGSAPSSLTPSINSERRVGSGECLNRKDKEQRSAEQAGRVSGLEHDLTAAAAEFKSRAQALEREREQLRSLTSELQREARAIEQERARLNRTDRAAVARFNGR